MTTTRTRHQRDQAQRLLGYLSTVQALIAGSPVAVPVGLDVKLYSDHVSVLLDTPNLPALAAGLLSWAAVLTDVTTEVWRSEEGHSVYVSITGRTLSGVCVEVYDEMACDTAELAGLAPGGKTSATLDQLRTWAAGEEA
jgi:hypothetical protein